MTTEKIQAWTFNQFLNYKNPDDPKIVLNPETQTITLNFLYPYQIDLDRIKNERDLLAWSLHLCEKNWMNTNRIAAFIHKVAEFKGLSAFELH